MVKETGKCNISVLSTDAVFETFKHFGFQSGRDVDKFADYPKEYYSMSSSRTSTIAFTNATLSYGLQIASSGLEEASKKNPAIASGVNCYAGSLTNKNVADALGIEFKALEEII